MAFVAVNLEELDAEVSQTVGAAWSSSTLATRNSQWGKYFKFCAQIGQPPMPADIRTIARFLVYLGRTCKYSTVNNYLSAVVALHKWYGYVPEFRESFLLKMVLKGLKSTLGDNVTQMRLLTMSQMVEMYARVVKSNSDRLMWAALMLSFRSLLRKSNIVPDTELDKHHVLRRKDLEFHRWGVMLHVR